MKAKTLLFLVALSLCAMSAAMYVDDDDDDNNDNDTYAMDWDEHAYCLGYDYPECGTEVDVPPQLISVTISVNGAIRTQPITLSLQDDVSFAIEFNYPNTTNNFCYGHLFIVKGGSSHCLDQIEGTISDEPFPHGIPGICSTEANGQPLTFPVDPSIFLNGTGAPYYLELSNACATHGNRLPLEIVTKDENDGGDSSDDEDDSSGHFSCS